MGYVLFAVLAPAALLEDEPPWISDSRVVHLEQGICMVPVTHQLYDDLGQQHPPAPDEDWAGFVLLPAPLMASLEQLSQRGTVAYVEADYFGGVGEQRCVVWRNGSVVLGPVEESGAINRALRQLGVAKQPFVDEFKAVGLDKYRSNEDWVQSAA